MGSPRPYQIRRGIIGLPERDLHPEGEPFPVFRAAHSTAPINGPFTQAQLNLFLEGRIHALEKSNKLLWQKVLALEHLARIDASNARSESSSATNSDLDELQTPSEQGDFQIAGLELATPSSEGS